MIWQETPYTIPLIVTSAISIMMALYVVVHRRMPGSKIGILIILATSEWMVTYALELASADLPSKIFWNKIQYIGIVAVPAVWFIFTTLYTGRERWLTRRTLAFLCIMPVATLLLVWTNEYHGLIWSSLILSTDGPFSALINIHGPWFWVNALYSYVLLLSGALMLLMQMFTCSHSLYRWQISVLLLGALFPWGANILFVVGLNPFPYLDLTPFGFLATNVVIALSIVYFRLGDFVPIARETVVESMKDSVIVLDAENRIIDMNSSAQQLIGHTTSKFIGNPVDSVLPEWAEQMELKTGPEEGKEIVLKREDKERIYDVSISSLSDWRGYTVSRVVVLRDITERKQVEEKIKASLKEKEVLLREIHHRVKNNIQVISSLLSLQSHYIKDKKYIEMLRESQDRIKSMALVHEKLYQSENLADINFGEYVKTLVESLFRSYGVSTKIQVKLEVEDVSLDIDTAIPCGLIINELVSNSLKHAFSDGKEGEITVALRSVNDTVNLTISDTGVGIPDTVDFRTTQSLGLRLVTILAEDQLEGEILLDRSKGTTFKITFKKRAAQPR